MKRDRKGKENKRAKKNGMASDNIEEQAKNFLDDAKLSDLDQVDIPDELKDRLESADTVELDDLERELGIDGDSILEEREKERKKQEVTPAETTDKVEAEGDDAALEEEVAEPIDGSCTVSISDDKMSVHMALIPSENNGVPLDYEKIKKELAASGVVFGVNEELLKKLIITVEKTKEAKEGVVVARGALPEDGKDGNIQFHFSDDDSILDEPAEESDQENQGVESE